LLNLYRRHQPPCSHTTRRYRNCNCPIWVQGSLRGDYIRRGLNLRSWSAATDLVRDWEAAGEIGVVKRAAVPTIAEAIEKFFTDAKAQHLSRETIRKYENLLNKRFLPWCVDKGFRYLKQLGVEEMREFRATWADSPIYATKNLERLRSFFRFCQHDDWIAKNPARAVKAPKVKDKPTLPFSKPEMQRIIDACALYRGDQDRLRAFVLVMRHSGLRIGDTIALDGKRLKGNKLMLYTAKTGTPVYVPLPPAAMKALGKIDRNGSDRFFSTGNAKPQTARSNWSRYLDSLFRLAKVDDGHSHRFRDTFAVELLLADVPLETVSVLLGHSSVKITERHYKPWVRSLQRKLEAEVKRAWDKAS
jgi:integrase/recombinase XerD